jgi:hypothetical protein
MFLSECFYDPREWLMPVDHVRGQSRRHRKGGGLVARALSKFADGTIPKIGRWLSKQEHEPVLKARLASRRIGQGLDELKQALCDQPAVAVSGKHVGIERHRGRRSPTLGFVESQPALNG